MSTLQGNVFFNSPGICTMQPGKDLTMYFCSEFMIKARFVIPLMGSGERNECQPSNIPIELIQ